MKQFISLQFLNQQRLKPFTPRKLTLNSADPLCLNLSIHIQLHGSEIECIEVCFKVMGFCQQRTHFGVIAKTKTVG